METGVWRNTVDIRKPNQTQKPSLDERRLKKFQITGLFVEDTSDTEYTRAATAEELEAAYKLVYEVYLREGYLLPNRFGIRLRSFELKPETATFIARSGKDVVGVLSLIADSGDLGLPIDEMFRDEIDSLRGPAHVIYELSNQAILSSNRNGAICTELMRCAFAHALYNGCTDLICAISPELVRFYSFIGFRQVSEIKSFSKKWDDPVIVMHLSDVQHRWTDLASSGEVVDLFWRDYFVHTNPYHDLIDLWNLAAKDMFDSRAEVDKLFSKYTCVIDPCVTRNKTKARWVQSQRLMPIRHNPTTAQKQAGHRHMQQRPIRFGPFSTSKPFLTDTAHTKFLHHL